MTTYQKLLSVLVEIFNSSDMELQIEGKGFAIFGEKDVTLFEKDGKEIKLNFGWSKKSMFLGFLSKHLTGNAVRHISVLTDYEVVLTIFELEKEAFGLFELMRELKAERKRIAVLSVDGKLFKALFYSDERLKDRGWCFPDAVFEGVPLVFSNRTGLDGLSGSVFWKNRVFKLKQGTKELRFEFKDVPFSIAAYVINKGGETVSFIHVVFENKEEYIMLKERWVSSLLLSLSSEPEWIMFLEG